MRTQALAYTRTCWGGPGAPWGSRSTAARCQGRLWSLLQSLTAHTKPHSQYWDMGRTALDSRTVFDIKFGAFGAFTDDKRTVM